MKTLPRDAVTLDRAGETYDLADLYVKVARIPNNNGSLLHSYETEVLMPLKGFVDGLADELTIRDALALEEAKPKKRAA